MSNEPSSHPALQHIRRMTFAGFLTVLPIAFALVVCRWLFGIIDGFVSPAVHMVVQTLDLSPPPALFVTFIGIAATLLLFFLVGLGTTHYIGKEALRWTELLFQRIPIYRNIYNAVKQILETLTFMEKKAFQEAVIIEYPRKDMYSLAFVTNELPGGVEGLIEQRMLTVFVPTCPNPTSGYVILVPVEDCFELNISIEEAMRFIFSAGVVSIAHRSIEGAAFAVEQTVRQGKN